MDQEVKAPHPVTLMIVKKYSKLFLQEEIQYPLSLTQINLDTKWG